MAAEHAAHTATLLKDGRVLIVGGIDRELGVDVSLTTAEIYDPVANSFSTTGSLIQPLGGHSAALLPSGKVVVTGGSPSGDSPLGASINFSQVWDPATGAWSFTGDQFSFIVRTSKAPSLPTLPSLPGIS